MIFVATNVGIMFFFVKESSNGFWWHKWGILETISKGDRMRTLSVNTANSLFFFITREEGFKMSTSFAIWPSERFEVRFGWIDFPTLLIKSAKFLPLDLLIVKCYNISSWNCGMKIILVCCMNRGSTVYVYDSNTRRVSIIMFNMIDLIKTCLHIFKFVSLVLIIVLSSRLIITDLFQF